MSVCAAPTCSHQSFDGSSYYVDVELCKFNGVRRNTILPCSFLMFNNFSDKISIYWFKE